MRRGPPSINQMIIHQLYGATVELHEQGKTKAFESAPAPLYLPQIPHGLPWERTLTSTLRIRLLTAWAAAWTSLGKKRSECETTCNCKVCNTNRIMYNHVSISRYGVVLRHRTTSPSLKPPFYFFYRRKDSHKNPCFVVRTFQNITGPEFHISWKRWSRASH